MQLNLFMFLHTWERAAQSMAVLKNWVLFRTLQGEKSESLVAFQPSSCLGYAVPSYLLFTSALELCVSFEVCITLVPLRTRYLPLRMLAAMKVDLCLR